MLDHLNRIIFAACLAVQAMADNEPSSCPALLTGGTFKYRDKTKATAAVHCKLFGEQELWTSWVNPMVPPTIIGADGTHMVREHTHVMLHYDVYSVSCKLVKHSLFFVTFFLCLLQAVKVAVSVMIEKIKIDTRDQVSKLHTHACTSARSP